jgi:predicted MFS family arabinose efflux permease
VRGWWRANIGGLPGTFWYLWIGLLINKVGGFGIIFLSLYLVKARGLDASGAGLVVGMYGVGGAAGVLAGGVLADRWGRRRTLVVSHLATTVCMLGLAFVPWIPLIGALTLLVGAAQSMVGPPLIAAMVDVVPEPDRTRAFSLEFWAINVGTTVAAPLAGLLADVGFTPLFLVEAGATFATLLILVLKVPETLVRRPAEQREGLGTVLTDRPWMTFFGLTLILAVLTSMTMTILPLAMAHDHLRPSAYGFVMGCAGFMIVAGQLFMPRLVGGRDDARVLALANGLLAVGIAFIAVCDVIPAYLGAAAVLTVGQMLGAPANATTISDLSTSTLRARYQAVFYLSFPLAGFVAPALGGWSLQHLGDWTWLICGALGGLAALGHLATGPARARRIARLRAAEAGREAVCLTT